jgi:hypothetical protein
MTVSCALVAEGGARNILFDVLFRVLSAFGHQMTIRFSKAAYQAVLFNDKQKSPSYLTEASLEARVLFFL